MSQDPATQAFTQSKCLDAMHLIHLFVRSYDKYRHDKTHTSPYFNFVNSMDVFHSECKNYGFTDE